ncbi:MAG: hypothetical protein K2N95_17020, partial [Lachnospiraceae bacterium]|nr:hypothetical protein [Lachnospiraceae bacterium]
DAELTKTARRAGCELPEEFVELYFTMIGDATMKQAEIIADRMRRYVKLECYGCIGRSPDTK